MFQVLIVPESRMRTPGKKTKGPAKKAIISTQITNTSVVAEPQQSMAATKTKARTHRRATNSEVVTEEAPVKRKRGRPPKKQNVQHPAAQQLITTNDASNNEMDEVDIETVSDGEAKVNGTPTSTTPLRESSTRTVRYLSNNNEDDDFQPPEIVLSNDYYDESSEDEEIFEAARKEHEYYERYQKKQHEERLQVHIEKLFRRRRVAQTEKDIQHEELINKIILEDFPEDAEDIPPEQMDCELIVPPRVKVLAPSFRIIKNQPPYKQSITKKFLEQYQKGLIRYSDDQKPSARSLSFGSPKQPSPSPAAATDTEDDQDSSYDSSISSASNSSSIVKIMIDRKEWSKEEILFARELFCAYGKDWRDISRLMHKAKSANQVKAFFVENVLDGKSSSNKDVSQAFAIFDRNVVSTQQDAPARTEAAAVPVTKPNSPAPDTDDKKKLSSANLNTEYKSWRVTTKDTCVPSAVYEGHGRPNNKRKAVTVSPAATKRKNGKQSGPEPDVVLSSPGDSVFVFYKCKTLMQGAWFEGVVLESRKETRNPHRLEYKVLIANMKVGKAFWAPQDRVKTELPEGTEVWMYTPMENSISDHSNLLLAASSSPARPSLISTPPIPPLSLKEDIDESPVPSIDASVVSLAGSASSMREDDVFPISVPESAELINALVASIYKVDKRVVQKWASAIADAGGAENLDFPMDARSLIDTTFNSIFNLVIRYESDISKDEPDLEYMKLHLDSLLMSVSHAVDDMFSSRGLCQPRQTNSSSAATTTTTTTKFDIKPRKDSLWIVYIPSSDYRDMSSHNCTLTLADCHVYNANNNNNNSDTTPQPQINDTVILYAFETITATEPVGEENNSSNGDSVMVATVLSLECQHDDASLCSSRSTTPGHGRRLRLQLQPQEALSHKLRSLDPKARSEQLEPHPDQRQVIEGVLRNSHCIMTLVEGDAANAIASELRTADITNNDNNLSTTTSSSSNGGALVVDTIRSDSTPVTPIRPVGGRSDDDGVKTRSARKRKVDSGEQSPISPSVLYLPLSTSKTRRTPAKNDDGSVPPRRGRGGSRKGVSSAVATPSKADAASPISSSSVAAADEATELLRSLTKPVCKLFLADREARIEARRLLQLRCEAVHEKYTKDIKRCTKAEDVFKVLKSMAKSVQRYREQLLVIMRQRFALFRAMVNKDAATTTGSSSSGGSGGGNGDSSTSTTASSQQSSDTTSSANYNNNNSTASTSTATSEAEVAGASSSSPSPSPATMTADDGTPTPTPTPTPMEIEASQQQQQQQQEQPAASTS